MKKILFTTMLCLLGLPAFAQTPSGYPPALSGSDSVIEYLNPIAVPLTEQEMRALNIAGDWNRNNIDPVLASGGKLVYVHGASIPTIVASPMQVSDLELEPGEIIHEFMVGDSARWMIDTGTVGNGASAITHVFIKPIDSGLDTSAVITTNRRVYHLRLVSQRSGHVPYIGFVYADSMRLQAANQQAQAARTAEWQSTTVDSGQRVDLSTLNFNYEVQGRASWRPERVYDDGQQMFIRLPAGGTSAEMPVLLVRRGSQDVLVNYRVQDSAIIVDGIFDRVALIIGVGRDQEKVEVVRGR